MAIFVDIVLVGRGEAANLVVGQRKGLDYPHAAQVLLDLGTHGPELLLHLAKAQAHLSPHPAGD